MSLQDDVDGPVIYVSKGLLMCALTKYVKTAAWISRLPTLKYDLELEWG